MGTRSVIAYATEDGRWEGGRYVHFDGYPNGVGAELWKLYHDHFDQLLPDMAEHLLERHTYWSGINAENLDCGAHCLCKGGSGAETYEVEDCRNVFIEWVYVLDVKENLLTIVKPVWPKDPDNNKPIEDDDVRFAIVASGPFDGPEPDWDAIGMANVEGTF